MIACRITTNGVHFRIERRIGFWPFYRWQAISAVEYDDVNRALGEVRAAEATLITRSWVEVPLRLAPIPPSKTP
jgi:hypothetical protein